MGLSSKATVSQGKSIARVVAPPAEQIFQPASGGLLLTGYAPTAGGASAQPAAGSLVLTGNVPVVGGINAKPAAGSLVLTGGTPTWWLPTLMSGLVAWYDAGQITGLSDGTAISQWNDLSGNAYHAVQATGTKQPLYKTGILNGRPVVRFDGTDDFFTASGLGALSDHSVFVVIKPAAGVDQTMLAGAPGNAQIRIGEVADKLQYYDGVANWRSSTLGVAQGNWMLLEIVFSSTVGSFYQNSTAYGTADYDGGMPSPAYGTIGAAYTGNSNRVNGDIAEIFYGTDVTSATRLGAEQYVRGKYALY